MKKIASLSTSVLVLTLLGLFISGCTLQPTPQKAKYVFYFIGDGMGPAQVAATEAYKASILDDIDQKPLLFTTFPVQSTATTFALDRLITGSAAAGTALATGEKTSIGAISMDSSHTRPLRTIAEIAKADGYKVGIISSVMINHATPAVFYAHQPSRSNYFEIALELPKSNFDFFGGGGLKHRKDTLNGKPVDALQLAIESGYTYSNTIESFENLSSEDLPILFESPKRESANSYAMPYRVDLEEADITLPNIVSKAIEVLDNENGFFMMVEGGKIDWVCHGNDGATVLHEVLDFEESVAVAYEFYKKHPEETLILVTADHETGGLTLGNRYNHYDTYFELAANQKQSILALSAEFDTYLAEHNNSISESEALAFIDSAFGLGSQVKLTDSDLAELKNAYQESVAGKNEAELYSETDQFITFAMHLLNKKAGFGWSTNAHTALPVPVYAIGVGAEQFAQRNDNTDLPKFLLNAMQIQSEKK